MNMLKVALLCAGLLFASHSNAECVAKYPKFVADAACTNLSTKAACDSLTDELKCVWNEVVPAADIPAGCRQCMAVPCQGKGSQPCYQACRSECSTGQRNAWIAEQEADAQADECYDCVSACPQSTAETKPCRKACEDKCPGDRMKKAIIRVDKEVYLRNQPQKESTGTDSSRTK